MHLYSKFLKHVLVVNQAYFSVLHWHCLSFSVFPHIFLIFPSSFSNTDTQAIFLRVSLNSELLHWESSHCPIFFFRHILFVLFIWKQLYVSWLVRFCVLSIALYPSNKGSYPHLPLPSATQKCPHLFWCSSPSSVRFQAAHDLFLLEYQRETSTF